MLTSEGDYPKTTVAGLETNTLWDGLFHAATWVAVAVGIWILAIAFTWVVGRAVARQERLVLQLEGTRRQLAEHAFHVRGRRGQHVGLRRGFLGLRCAARDRWMAARSLRRADIAHPSYEALTNTRE